MSTSIHGRILDYVPVLQVVCAGGWSPSLHLVVARDLKGPVACSFDESTSVAQCGAVWNKSRLGGLGRILQPK